MSPLPASRPDLRPDASLPLPCLPPEPLSPFLPALSPFFFSSSLPSALPDELRSSSAAAARIASCARERWRNGVGRRSVDVTGWSFGVTASSERGRNGARGRWTGFDGERRRKSFDVVFGLGKKRALVGDVRSGVGHSPVRGWRRFGPHPSRWPLHVWHHSRQPPPWPRRVREPTPRPWKRAPSPREIRVFLPLYARFTGDFSFRQTLPRGSCATGKRERPRPNASGVCREYRGIDTYAVWRWSPRARRSGDQCWKSPTQKSQKNVTRKSIGCSRFTCANLIRI